jgi:drug/metabolite transporter (DMT)-like permease
MSPPSRFAAPVWDWLALAFVVAIWGSAFAFLHIAAESIDPAWTAAGRLAVAVVFLRVCLVLKRAPAPPTRFDWNDPWPWFAIVGAVGTALPFFMFAFSAAHLDTGLVAILNGGSPFFTAGFAAALLGERIGMRRGVGVAMGFAGLVLLAAPASQGQFGAMGGLAVAAGILGAAGYGLANVLTKKAPPLDPIAASYIYCLVGLLAALGFALLSGAPWPHAAGPIEWSAIVVLGLGPTAIAGIVFVWLVRRRGPLFTAMATYLTPLWALGVGVWFLNERPGPEALMALGLILAGVWVANAGPSRPQRSAQTS